MINTSSSNVSRLLVVAQFVLIALIASPASELLPDSPLSVAGALLILSALVLALWALKSMQSGTFTVLPEPSKNGALTQSGPYAYVRHPMYSAVLLGASGATISHSSWWACLLLVLLTGVLLIKIQREEKLLNDHYEQYERYRENTNPLIPFVF